MKRKPKIILSIVLALMIVIPVFATNYNVSKIKMGKLFYPGDKLENDLNVLEELYYCPTEDNCEYYNIYDSNKILTLSEFNEIYNSEKIPEKNDQGESFVGWKVIEVYNSSSTNNRGRGLRLKPEYGVKHRITKQPTNDDPAVEVTEKEEVKSYTWYRIEKKQTPVSYAEYSVVDQNHQGVPDDKLLTYDDKTNSLVLNYSNALINSKGKIEIGENAKLTITNKEVSNYIVGSSVTIYDEKENEIGKYSLYERDAKTKIAENGEKVYYQVFDLGNIKPGIYNIHFYNNSSLGNEVPQKFIFENATIYGEVENLLNNETEQTLKNGENDKEYIVKIDYNDGATLVSEKFTYKKSVPNIIEEKITDIVANPLTGDNIIYTVIVVLISLTMIVLLSKKLKSN